MKTTYRSPVRCSPAPSSRRRVRSSPGREARIQPAPVIRAALVLVGAGAALLFGTSAAPAAGSRDLRITVYNNDLGLVRDQRSIAVPEGRGTVEINDVPAQIDPTSVHLKPLEGSAQILEQDFQYDLASADRILQKYVDSEIDAVLKDGAVRSGKLLSYDAASVVLQGKEGGVGLIARDQIVDLRFPQLPEGLRTRPTLVWLLDGGRAGDTPVELSYLTGGLNWHAEYVAVTDENDTSMELSAWVSLENNSGATYPDAQLQLIAGEVQRVQPPRPMLEKDEALRAMAAPTPQGFAEETFFEYHLYTLDRRTTLNDRETKQLALFPPATTPVKKIYEYNGQRDDKSVRVILESENKKELGLGMPLPAGKVRVYQKDAHGNLQFVGEDMINHTPRDEKVRLTVGHAFEVVGERTELSANRISDRVSERDIQVKIRNHKTEKIQVVVQETLSGYWTITKSSVPFTRKDANTAEFILAVDPGQETVLTFTVRNEF